MGVASPPVTAQTAIERLGGSILRTDQRIWRWEHDAPVRTPQNEAEGASWDPMIEQEQVARELEQGPYEIGAIDAELLVDRYPHDIDQVDIAIQQGLALIRRGELGRARTEFNRAYEIANSDERYEEGAELGTALYYIALTGLADGYQPTEKTTVILEEFLKRYPGHPKESAVLHLLGEIAESRGRYDRAADYYRSELLKNIGGDRRSINNAMTRVLLLAGNYEEAAHALEENRGMVASTAADDPYDEVTEEAWLRGQLYLHTGNYKEAEAEFIRVLDDRESEYRRKGLLGLADTYNAVQLYDSSVSLYGRLIRDDSDDVPGMAARFRRALAMIAANDSVNGNAELEAVASDDRNLFNDLALLRQGERFYRSRRYPEALEKVTRAVNTGRTPQTRVRGYALGAAIHLALGDPQKANEELKAADALIPDNRVGDAYGLVSLLRGIALVQLNQPAEAITLLNTSLERQRNDSLADQAMYWLGEAYYQSGLYQASAGTLDKLVGRYPNSPYTADALYTIGWSYLRMKKFDKAGDSFRNLVKAFPLSQYVAEAQVRRGDALYLAGNYQEAIEAYNEVGRANPSRELADHAAYQKGLAQAALGDVGGALATFDVLARCHPESDMLDDALYAEGTMALAAGAYTKGSIVAREIVMRKGGEEEKKIAAYILMAKIYEEMDEGEKAAAIYSIIEAKHPGSDLASDAGKEIERLRNVGDDDEHVDAEEHGCDPYSRTGMALERGDIYLMLGRPVDALAEFRGVENNAVGECAAHALLGIARGEAALGNGDVAADTLKILLDASPDGPYAAEAIAALGEIALSHRDTTGALAWLRRAGPLGSDGGESLAARRRIAALYERSRMVDSAISLLYANARIGGSKQETALAWIALAGIERDSARGDTLRAMLKGIPMTSPELANEATIALARSLAMAGRSKEAADVLTVLGTPEQGDGAIDGPMAMALAEVNEMIGSIANARAWYRYVADGCFGEEIGTRAAQRLEALKKL